MNCAVVLALDADRHTNAKVTQGFHTIGKSLSALPGVIVLQADWDISRGKGPDDLLVAGWYPSITPYIPLVAPGALATVRTERGKHPRQVVRVEADFLASWRRRKAVEAVEAIETDLASVRKAIARIVTAAAGPQTATSTPRVDVVEVPTGGGKTITAALALQEVLRDALEHDRAMGRVLFLMPTHDQIKELLADPRLSYLREHSAIRYGRSPVDNEPGHCQDKTAGNGNTSGRFSENCHGVAKNYCKAPAEGGQCRFAGQCAQRGYLAHLAECRAARVVFAATAAVGMAPSELNEFSCVIVDEDITAALSDKRTVRKDHADGWCSGIAIRESLVATGPNPYGPRGSARTFVDILRDILAAQLPEGHATEPLLPLFDARARGRGVDDPTGLLHDVLGACGRYGGDTFPWEEPEWSSERRAWLIPMRAGADIARALLDDIRRQDPSISKVALTRQGIEVRTYRTEQIGILRRKQVVNLDATPCMPKIRLLFPGCVETRLALPVLQEVTQITDAIFTPEHVLKDVARLQPLVEAFTRGERAPLVVCHKARNPKAQHAREPGAPEPIVFSSSNPSTAWLHYGNARGTNEHEACSAVILVGCHIRNVSDVENEFRAYRAEFGVETATRPSTPHTEAHAEAVATPEIRTLVPYGWGDADGSGLARYVRVSADPDVTEHLAWQWHTEVTQAIGRLRPSSDARRGSPVRVLLLSGLPVDGLTVNRLTSIRELELEHGITPPAPRGENLEGWNDMEREDFRERVLQAAVEIEAEGGEVTAREVTRRTGVVNGDRLRRVREVLSEAGHPVHPDGTDSVSVPVHPDNTESGVTNGEAHGKPMCELADPCTPITYTCSNAIGVHGSANRIPPVIDALLDNGASSTQADVDGWEIVLDEPPSPPPSPQHPRPPGFCFACGKNEWTQATPTRPRVCVVCHPRARAPAPS